MLRYGIPGKHFDLVANGMAPQRHAVRVNNPTLTATMSGFEYRFGSVWGTEFNCTFFLLWAMPAYLFIEFAETM